MRGFLSVGRNGISFVAVAVDVIVYICLISIFKQTTSKLISLLVTMVNIRMIFRICSKISLTIKFRNNVWLGASHTFFGKS